MRRGGAVVATSSARKKHRRRHVEPSRRARSSSPDLTKPATSGVRSSRPETFPSRKLRARFSSATPSRRRRLLEPSRGDLGRGWPWRRRRGLRPPRCSSSSAQVLLSPSPSSARPPLSNLSRRVDAVASDWLMFRALTW
jgi:hypothetical protein